MLVAPGQRTELEDLRQVIWNYIPALILLGEGALYEAVP